MINIDHRRPMELMPAAFDTHERGIGALAPPTQATIASARKIQSIRFTISADDLS